LRKSGKEEGMKMKKMYFVLLTILQYSIFAQNTEPTQIQFRIGGFNAPLIYLSADSAYWKQDNFILGWALGRTEENFSFIIN
jgi:hypothetical protein